MVVHLQKRLWSLIQCHLNTRPWCIPCVPVHAECTKLSAGSVQSQHGNHTLLYVDDVACTEALFQLLGGSIASHELGQTVVAAKAAVLTCTVLLEGRKEAAGAWSSL